jgi:UDP-N-acetylmuramate--alanine ligase
MFLGLRPRIAVLTNIEYDHPDCFPTPDDYFRAFEEFAACIDENGILVASVDDLGSARLFQHVSKQGLKPVSYGIKSISDQIQPDYKAKDLIMNEEGGYRFTINKFNQALGEVSLQVPGEHNVHNAWQRGCVVC